ncbi:hypothetical protein [Candidatus Magnetominusculus xianensis]|uniref:Uncharacterized protein n=1 Tax=Candidatus Magnetominusculus xianensis TaxID=1748249 RepID=A0ABR5SJY9_9BACT|nr:hypothetical protein [Candidatus Magnetominusculus xianensis]KWT95155.1 hypothetical protein ASN18_0084 [Candidatus Magnetominusculus xianensis]MBF0402802.1 hypothetical protein [Nitrospirota bacterium]
MNEMYNLSDVYCSVLFESMSPELYQTNAFRVTGLSVDVTTRDIQRQEGKLAMTERLGGEIPQNGRILPLKSPPDVYMVKKAAQRLKDPERRLVDEFFWFWPHEHGNSASDAAIIELMNGNSKKSIEIWNSNENNLSVSNVSMHNVAVFYHLTALDIEHAGMNGGFSESQKAERDKCWDGVFKRWGKLLEHEGFWSMLTARIRELDDPLLTTGMARRIRTSLPYALLSINAQLAIKFAEGGNAIETKRQLSIMSNSGFERDIIDTTLQNAVDPIRQRIKILCKNARSETEVNPEHADGVVRDLIERTKPLLSIISQVLPLGNIIRDAAFDEVALCARDCLIEFANKTWNIINFYELLTIVKYMAASEALIARIEENKNNAEEILGEVAVETIKQIVDNGHDNEKCWFCEKNEPDNSSGIGVAMHGEIKSISYNKGQLKHITINVPRCLQCLDIHKGQSLLRKYKVSTYLLVSAVVLSAIWIYIVPSSDMMLKYIYFVAALSIIPANLIGAKLYLMKYTYELKGIIFKSIKTSIKSKGKRYKHPKVLKLRKIGWVYGEKPLNVQ